MKITIPNPWTKLEPNKLLQNNLIPPKSQVYANVDKDAIFVDIQKNYPNLFNDLRLDLYPEPFIGDPDAKIYLLNGNPGYVKGEEQFVQKSKNFCNAMKQNLDLKATSFLYLDEEVCTYDNPGYQWWERHLRQLTNAIGRSPKIFNIEYFPYHSKNLDNVKSWIKKENHLPSENFSDDLIKNAMNDGKIIVIMRLKDAWYNRIKGLNGYSNLIELCNPQSVYITPNNVTYPAVNQKLWGHLVFNA